MQMEHCLGSSSLSCGVDNSWTFEFLVLPGGSRGIAVSIIVKYNFYVCIIQCQWLIRRWGTLGAMAPTNKGSEEFFCCFYLTVSPQSALQKCRISSGFFQNSSPSKSPRSSTEELWYFMLLLVHCKLFQHWFSSVFQQKCDITFHCT